MGTSEELKLIGIRASPPVNRVQITLNLKSLDYEFVQEKSFPAEKSDLLLKSNPVHKKIPVLIHNDKPISESLVIVEYIDQVWTTGRPSILPCDPYERAQVRFWAAYVDLTLFPALKDVGFEQDEETKKAASLKVIESMLLLEDVFVKSSKGKAFFGGDEIGYLDIAFGCILGWLKLTETLNNVKFIDQVKTPRLAGWATAFLSHGATKDVIPDQVELMEIYNKYQASLSAAAAAVSN